MVLESSERELIASCQQGDHEAFRELFATYKDKVTVKGAVVEGQKITFQQALEMPTREEAIGQIIGMIVGVGGALAGLLTGPASQVASQIQTIAERKPEEGGAAEAPAAGEAPPERTPPT